MTREFPDELLSALLDDELPPAERAQVEQHLAGSEADRQLLTELKSLRAEVAALPQAKVSPDFAERVVQAAVAEAERHNGSRGVVSQAPPRVGRFSKRSLAGAAFASAAALAASFFLLVAQPWRPAGQPGAALPLAGIASPSVEQAVALKDQLIRALSAATPAEGEAVVLRLRMRKGVSLADALDAALSKAGIAARAADPGNSANLVSAYSRAFEAKYGKSAGGAENKALADATIAAAEAVFIEAPLERLEAAFSDLSTGIQQPMTLESAAKLALYRGRPDDGPEGESSSANKSAKPAAGQAFAQRLNAGLFRLEKKLADAAQAAVTVQPPATSLTPQQLVRVLILVEIE